MQQIIDFFMIDNFNLLEMLVWCFCSGALVFFAFISLLKKEQTKTKDFCSYVKSFTSPDIVNSDEIIDDLDMLDL